MNRSIIRILGLVVLMLNIDICFAQHQKIKKIPKPNEYISLQEIKARGLTFQDIKRESSHRSSSYSIGPGKVGVSGANSALYQRLSTIDHFKTPNFLQWYNKTIHQIGENYVLVLVKHPIIAVGEYTKIRFYFDNRYVERIAIDGVGETTPEHIQEGTYDVILTPKETFLLKSTIYTKDKDGNRSSFDDYRRIIVVKPEELNDVMEQADFLLYSARQNVLNSGGSIDSEVYQNPKKYCKYLDKIANGVPAGNYPNVQRFGNVTDSSMFLLVKDDISTPDTKTILRIETAQFDNPIYIDPKTEKYIHSTIEHQVIANGDSTRIRYVFNNRKIDHIEVVGVKSTTREDIKRGIFEVTLKPEKTTLYKVNMRTNHSRLARNILGHRVIVIDPEKYDEVLKTVYILRNGNGDISRYLDHLAGDVPRF